jgi:hypothetical protein
MSRFFIFLCLVLQPMFVFSYEYEVAIGAIFQNEAPYLKEWIDYHRKVGVEHFWLYNDVSTDHWAEVLQPYIDEGIVTVIDWAECRELINDWPQIQVEAYRDVMKRALGTTKWLALIDIDEFILPMKEKTIRKCLKNHFSDEKAVYMQWLVFGTSGVTLSENESMLERLTSCSDIGHPWNSIGKTIVRPESVVIEKIWYPHHVPLKKSRSYADGSGGEIPMINDDLHMTGHYGKYIRINHYFFRDERFFHEVKLPRKLNQKMALDHLYELYDACSQSEDFAIFNLLGK